ncbi:MAG: hypothetical protein CFE29_03120 [Bradyrhizobiaceae bacterium PARB1]|jgi:hypothetical protein|nr:MAG: hypothetical protein CFE29_03120 [Bradyrhizobiaceae bacterium PARB1]
MSNDGPIEEAFTGPVIVPETNRLWRLTPALNLLEKSRQIAIVPGETEDDARALATTADPLGRNWKDPYPFSADSIDASERHVIGDVIFRSPQRSRHSKNDQRRADHDENEGQEI